MLKMLFTVMLSFHCCCALYWFPVKHLLKYTIPLSHANACNKHSFVQYWSFSLSTKICKLKYFPFVHIITRNVKQFKGRPHHVCDIFTLNNVSDLLNICKSFKFLKLINHLHDLQHNAIIIPHWINNLFFTNFAIFRFLQKSIKFPIL